VTDGIGRSLKKALASRFAGSHRIEERPPPPGPSAPPSAPNPPDAPVPTAAPVVEKAEPRLAVVFVQYDRRKYDGALERLLALLDGLSGIPYQVLVIDNARPGDWEHPVSSRVTHVGGDNTGWEFSAFDKGLALLDGLPEKPDAIVLCTDAFSAYGDDFLGLVDANLVRQALALEACVGWVDAWPERADLFGQEDRAWLRTSLLIAPTHLLDSVRPLCAPIDDETIFSGEPGQPFRSTAPLSENLRRYLLEWLVGGGTEELTEPWHSRFTLTAETFEFFQAKVRAILREHLLSVRLRQRGTPAFDLRLIAHMQRGGVPARELDAARLAGWQWDSWQAFVEEAARSLNFRSHIEHVGLPRAVPHGEALPLTLKGWVLAARAPEFVQITVDGRSIVCPVDEDRQDVVAKYPAYQQTRCGFSVDRSVEGLTAGTHDVVLSFDGIAEKKTIAQVRVLPAAQFRVLRSAQPDTWPAGVPVPISLEGELRASFRALTAVLHFDGATVDRGVLLGSGSQDEGGAWTHRVWVNAQVSRTSSSEQFPLELCFDCENDLRHEWRKHVRIVSQAAPSRLLTLEFGPYRPAVGLTDVRIEADVFDAQAGDHLVLCADGKEVLDVPISEDLQGPDQQPRRVSIRRGVEGLGPGTVHAALALRRGARAREFWSGTRLVAYDRPEVHLEHVRVELFGTAEHPRHRLSLRGWVKNHFLVDCLLVEVGASQAGVLGLHELRPDVSEAHGNPFVMQQGFDAVLELENIPPGEHVVHLVATQRGGESARLSRRVEFDDVPHHRFAVASPELERIARGELTQFYSSITIRGALRTIVSDVVIALLVDDKVADEQAFDAPGEHTFQLRAVPPASGDYAVRFVVSHRGRLTYSTEAQTIGFRRTEFPARAVRAVTTLLDRFELRDRIIDLSNDRELTERLVEAQPERVPEYLGMLDAVYQRLQGEAPEGRVTQPEKHLARPLRVLVVTWETPSRYHGGGVYLTNMLAGLGQQHEITLVHTYGVDEIGHVDAVRPHVRRVISIPRTYRPAAYRGSGMFPQQLYDGYIPELHRVVELEATSGAYDLIDYEYSALGPYVIPGVPSVFTVHEMGYTALLNSAFRKARALDTVLPELDRLIRTFYYNTCELPALSPRLMTLTPEDADALTRFSPTATVYTSPTGVDVDHFAEAAEVAPDPEDPPAIVYVGNFQHPPNIVAVTFFAREIMPLVRRSHPKAEFHVIGSRAPSEIRELDGENGVRVIGFVEDLRPWLSGAAAYVAPLFTGTGMRIKVLEALAAGVPFIGTDLSVRGLPLEDNVHYLAANDIAGFVRAVSFAIEHPTAARAIARRAATLVGERFSWEAAVQQRDAIWQTVVAASREATTSSGAPHAEEQLLS
jgi:glycosyltransferase involved in cell wall biosynthesis